MAVKSVTQTVDRFIESIDFKKILDPRQSFSNYLESRSSDNFFKEIENSAGIKFADNAAKNAVKNSLADVFKSSPPIEKAQQDFNITIDKITSFDKVDVTYPARDAALKAITEEHKREKDALTNKFTDVDFLKKLGLTDAAGNTDAIKMEAVKKDVLEKLEQSQKKQNEKFQTDINLSIINMHNEIARIMALHSMLNLHKYNEDKKEKITALFEANRQPAGAGVQVAVDGQNQSALFKGITPGAGVLAAFKTAGGTDVTQTADGSFKVSFKNRVRTYLFGGDTIANDMRCIAQAVRAQGFDTITMSVKHSDPEYQMRMARSALVAAREQGFDPKNITININGKPTPAEEIIKQGPYSQHAIDLAGTESKKALGEGAADIYKSTRFKQLLNAAKEAKPAAPAPQADAVVIQQAAAAGPAA